MSESKISNEDMMLEMQKHMDIKAPAITRPVTLEYSAGSIPIKYKWFKLKIEGSVTILPVDLNLKVEVELPFVGWTTIGHIHGLGGSVGKKPFAELGIRYDSAQREIIGDGTIFGKSFHAVLFRFGAPLLKAGPVSHVESPHFVNQLTDAFLTHKGKDIGARFSTFDLKAGKHEEHSHSQDSIKILTNGFVKMTIAGKETALKPGDMIKIPANTKYSMLVPEGGLKGICVCAFLYSI